jgi:hypothetical protein
MKITYRVCDFYLWGNFTGKVYRKNLCTAEVLQKKNMAALIIGDELQHVLQGFLRQCEVHLRAEGDHFEPNV